MLKFNCILLTTQTKQTEKQSRPRQKWRNKRHRTTISSVERYMDAFQSGNCAVSATRFTDLKNKKNVSVHFVLLVKK